VANAIGLPQWRHAGASAVGPDASPPCDTVVPMKDASTIAAELGVPERVLLFCVASNTEWERAGITGTVVTAAIVRGLVQRDPLGQLSLTKQGREVFQELISR
jgi:hypothetical protein